VVLDFCKVPNASKCLAPLPPRSALRRGVYLGWCDALCAVYVEGILLVPHALIVLCTASHAMECEDSSRLMSKF
jgi:hypothetical protein